MDRQKSILLTSEAAGPRQKKRNSVHYPEESRPPPIVPPREILSSQNHPGASGSSGVSRISHGAGAGGGSGHTGSGRVETLIREAAVIDFDNLSDDWTPLSDTLQDRLDFSSVFGEVQGKYNENEEYDDEINGTQIPRGDKLTKEQKKMARAPEQKITIFAFRLALIEKAASGLGTIAFLWATVVILGGFASTVLLTDFLVVTMIILAETSRVFSRSHELEWQHLSSKSDKGGGLGLNRLLNAARSLSGISRKRSDSSKHVRRATSAPSRLAIWDNRNSPSPESDLRTPNNSNSTSSRLNRRQVAASASGPLPTPLPRPDSLLEGHRRTWAILAVPVLPIANDIFTAELVSRVLYSAQVASAVVSIGLSFWRLSVQDFYKKVDGQRQPNVVVSMNVFYVLAVLQASLFLVERIYWEYRIRLKKLLDEVCNEDYVGKENADLVKQFFYDVYDESLKGSVFDGLEMDLVKYSIEWLQTEVFNQQLGGARLLNNFVTKDDKFRHNDRFASDALRRLGTTPGIIERLVEMLSWGSRREEELLREISSIICRLVVYNRNCARFVAVPGAMDGVVSLLFPHGTNASAPLLGSKSAADPYYLRLMGLRILKYLCKDHKNSLKIGETRGLLSVLMVFIEVPGEGSLRWNGKSQTKNFTLKTYKKSLQVLRLLAAATNTSGQALRKRMAAIVSGLKNLRDIIEFGTEQPELQRLSIEILYHLAMEEDVRQMIGATGGVVRILFNLFAAHPLHGEASATAGATKKGRDERKLASQKAGETLTRLVLQNQENCERLLELKNDKKEKVLVDVMVAALSADHEKIASCAAHILRSVMKYADQTTRGEIATKTATLVVKNIFVRTGALTKSEIYETSIGLAARTLEPLDSEMYWDILRTVNKVEFVEQLMRNLQHTPTTNKYPRIRRFSVELIIALIQKDDSFLDTFKRHNLDLKSVLERTLDSVSEVENFCLFSGLVGYTKFYEKIENLVKQAITEVDNYHARSTSTEIPDPLAK